MTGAGSDGMIKPISWLHNRLIDRMLLRSIKFTRMTVNIFFDRIRYPLLCPFFIVSPAPEIDGADREILWVGRCAGRPCSIQERRVDNGGE